MLFSIAPISPLSHGWIISRRGSGTECVATALIGWVVPQASTWTLSSSAGEARPVRMPLRSCWRTSTARDILRSVSPRTGSISLTDPPPLVGPGPYRCLLGNERTHVLVALHDTLQVGAIAKVEDDDRELVVHAQRERGAVHHLESALERLHVAQALVLPRHGARQRVRV